MTLSFIDQLTQALGCQVNQYNRSTLYFHLENFLITLHLPQASQKFEDDAAFLHISFGLVTAGRTLRIYRLLLEANLTVYAQDQAQLGINPEDDNIILISRIPIDGDFNAYRIAELAYHYVEHGRYWKNTLMECNDDMYEDLCTGHYLWIRV